MWRFKQNPEQNVELSFASVWNRDVNRGSSKRRKITECNSMGEKYVGLSDKVNTKHKEQEQEHHN